MLLETNLKIIENKGYFLFLNPAGGPNHAEAILIPLLILRDKAN